MTYRRPSVLTYSGIVAAKINFDGLLFLYSKRRGTFGLLRRRDLVRCTWESFTLDRDHRCHVYPVNHGPR